MKHFTELLPEPLPPEPLVVLNQWMAHSWQQRLQPNPNAMVLATSEPDGHVSARVVLCKEIVAQPGYLVFFTNYLSRKGRQLARNPRAAAVIHWDALHRQVRVEGPVVPAPAAASDAYFASRPWQSRVGAWASEQSAPIASREALQKAVTSAAERFVYRTRDRQLPTAPPTIRSRDRRTGVVITCGPTRWSCGLKVKAGSMIARVGHVS